MVYIQQNFALHVYSTFYVFCTSGHPINLLCPQPRQNTALMPLTTALTKFDLDMAP